MYPLRTYCGLGHSLALASSPISIPKGTSKFSKRDTFKSRNRYEESPAHTPQYKLDRFKEKAPAKIQKRIREAESKSDMVRLNRYIANAGICSRRDADKLIEAGEIKVNNKVITEMGYKVKLEDEVRYDGARINPEQKAYVLLNKPKGFATTTSEGKGRTVMDLVANATSSRIKPIGRLGRNSKGLLLFTNDDAISSKFTNSKHGVARLFHLELDKNLKLEDLMIKMPQPDHLILKHKII